MSESSGKFDPGWNDPPMLNYSTSNPPPKSRIANKRIPFPLSAKDQNVLKYSRPPKLDIGKVNEVDSVWNTNSVLETVKENFNNVLKNENHSEVGIKLDILWKDWEDGKFSVQTKKVILELSEALTESNPEKANKCLVYLTMEYASASWISALHTLLMK